MLYLAATSDLVSSNTGRESPSLRMNLSTWDTIILRIIMRRTLGWRVFRDKGYDLSRGFLNYSKTITVDEIQTAYTYFDNVN